MYLWLCRCFFIVSDPLSSIFLSSIVKLYEYIWVVWFDIWKPDTFHIKLFILWGGLLFSMLYSFRLGVNNILYKDMIINHEKIANWEDEFVFRSVKDNSVLSSFDHSQHKKSTYNSCQNNLKNDIYATILDCNNCSQVFLANVSLAILIERSIILFWS